MLMQNFRGATKSIMLFLQKAYRAQNKSYFLKEHAAVAVFSAYSNFRTTR